MSADSSSPPSVSGSRPLWPDSPALPPGGQTVPDDEQFIRQVFGQNPQKGCELLFREYYGPLCSHASRFVYAREIARDLVSDTFYIFLQKQIYQKITTSYRAYLYTAVRNRAIKYLQREFGKQIAVTHLDATDEQDLLVWAEIITPEDLLTYDELHNRVEAAIGALSPQRQRVFLMNRFEGKKYQAIADELQISLKAVEAHISKALASLRKALQSD